MDKLRRWLAVAARSNIVRAILSAAFLVLAEQVAARPRKPERRDK